MTNIRRTFVPMPQKNGVHRAPDEIETELRALHGKGVSKTEAAKILGVHRNRLVALAVLFGLEFRSRGSISNLQYEDCQAAGMTLQGAADHLGITYSAVVARARFLNLHFAGTRSGPNPEARPVSRKPVVRSMKTDKAAINAALIKQGRPPLP
jgi:hypothetical protein